MATFTETTFGATGDGSVVRCSRCIVGVTGSFTATIAIKWIDKGGTEHTVQDSGADLTFTAAGEKVLDFGVPVSVFAECTAYTSGSPKVCIQGATLTYP